VFTIQDVDARVYGSIRCDYSADEMVEFSSGFRGEGDTVKQPGLIVSVPVGPQLLGRVVDALDNPIDGKGPIRCKEHCQGLQSSTTDMPAQRSSNLHRHNLQTTFATLLNKTYSKSSHERSCIGRRQEIRIKIRHYPKALTSVSTVEILAAFISKETAGNEFNVIIMFTDVMVPIGHGQRELIIGDQQTGKTAVALDPILNQKRWNDQTD
ncbi:hypothetical protein MJO29_011292, partial [Puccinia striiformis f. sp. tritici]